MLKRSLLSTFLMACLISSISPREVAAHDTANDGQMGVILHIEPSDNPVALKPQSLIFYYNDLNRQFNLYKCLCQVTVRGSIIPQTVKASSTSEGSISYIFPSAGAYSLYVKGQPQPATAFVPFAVNFDIQVNPGSSAPNKNSDSRSTRLASILFRVSLVPLCAISIQTYRITRKNKKT